MSALRPSATEKEEGGLTRFNTPEHAVLLKVGRAVSCELRREHQSERPVAVADLAPRFVRRLRPEWRVVVDEQVRVCDPRTPYARLIAAHGDDDVGREEGFPVAVEAGAYDTLDLEGGEGEVASVGEVTGPSAICGRESQSDHGGA